MMGHSNGGQGAWHLSSRYPDRVLGGWYFHPPACVFVLNDSVIPAAGYIKSQSYVPLQITR